MNRFVCGLVCFVVVACAVHAAERALTDEVVQSYVDAYEKYQVKFDKHYATKEDYEKHLRAYAASMEELKELRVMHAGENVVFGETSRSDLLEEEKGFLATAVPFDPAVHGPRANYNSKPQPEMAVDLGHTADNVPTEFNWFNISGVQHPAKNQGSCGSCWAFAAIGALEMQAVLEGHSWIDLSRQQAVDCANTSTTRGCCGGFPGDVYAKISSYVTETNYPYELSGGYSTCNPTECRSAGKPTVPWELRGYDRFTPMTESELKKQIWMYGPIAVWINAIDGFSSYKGGIFKCKTNSTSGGAHYVTAVGFGPGYIAIRNSWGPNWGLNGDILVSTESDIASCMMLRIRNYYQLARVSVKPSEAIQCTSGVCCNIPHQRFKVAGTICRNSTDGCDAAETCTGNSADCPPDEISPAGTICNYASDVCENHAVCDGKSTKCPAKTLKPAGTICRNKTTICDVAETCTGKSVACPADKFAPAGTICSNATGDCQNNAVCNGTSKYCPSKTLKPAGTVCRAKNGTCDIEETCTGNTTSCPTNRYAPSGTVCDPASGPCETDAVCSGYSRLCPEKKKKARGTVCRNATGLCDVAEYCNGSSAQCPPDQFRPSDVICYSDCPNESKNSDESDLSPIPCEILNCTGDSPYCPNEIPSEIPSEIPVSSSFMLNPQYVFAAMVLLLQVMLW